MKAIILVDIQNDFVKGGALEVPKGETIVPLVNALQEDFEWVIATQDFHPANHGSFASQHAGKKPGELIDLNGLTQVLWPDHCVQGTKGADFVRSLDLSNLNKVFTKGTDPGIDSYSGFFDNGHRKSTGLHDYLQEKGVKEVYVVGLATDYCVKFTALDAAQLGYQTFVIQDATKGVELQPGDVEKAFVEMSQAGVKLLHSREVLKA